MRRSILRAVSAALFVLTTLVTPQIGTDTAPSIGQPAAAAEVREQKQPAFWQMYYNFAPPTDEFIAELAAEQGMA